jgi:hypothetical protein
MTLTNEEFANQASDSSFRTGVIDNFAYYTGVGSNLPRGESNFTVF